MLLMPRRCSVHVTYTTEPLENINSIFDRLRAATVEGRIVLDFAA